MVVQMETVDHGVKSLQRILGLSSPTPVYLAGAVLVGTATLWLLRKYFSGGACRNKNRLDGKTVIITGANTGIGKETAIELAKRGAKIYMGCRSTQRGEKALGEVKVSSGSKEVFLLKIDLASKRSIREFVDNFLSRESHLHILINNAGIMQVPEGKTEDGFERQIGTNHLGHFYLTHLLLDTLKESAPSRIINVASLAHAFSKIDLDDLNITKVKYSSTTAYGNSKEANMLHALELARRLKGTGVTAYSLHPGSVNTELAREWNFLVGGLTKTLLCLFIKTPYQGAQTSIYLATEEGIEEHSGKYFRDCHLATPWNGILSDPAKAKKLWEVSKEMLELTSQI